MEERLQKLLSRAGFGSRRRCEEIIANGRVQLNGRAARLGDKADPAQDKIAVDGQPIRIKAHNFIYIALHKPKGVLSSLEDELGEGRKTVRDLVPLPGHLYPVGRLDKQSTGLMLMTNDGDLAHKLTHPRYGHRKMYHVTVSGNVPPHILQQWRDGVWLDERKTVPADIKALRKGKDFTFLEIIMREGRKRQIRRVANILGYPVRSLVRQRIGPISLGNLGVGEWRHLTNSEIAALRKISRQKGEKSPDARRQKSTKSRRRPKTGGSGRPSSPSPKPHQRSTTKSTKKRKR